MKCHVNAIQWGGVSARFSGGGVVAEIFRDLEKPMRFSEEGGG